MTPFSYVLKGGSITAAPFAKRIYAGKAWKACRDAYFAHRHGICERCGAPGVEVHHKKAITPLNADDPEIVYGWANLELLCRDCHISEHEKKKNLRSARPAQEADLRYMFDEQGNPTPRGAVRVVWGSPASGKSTYVAQHMQHMDIVIDLDNILRCFTGLTNKADDPSSIKDYLPFTLSVRDACYRLIQQDSKGIRTAWIVAGLPRKQDRMLLQARFPNARFIHIETSCEESLARAAADINRPNKEHMRKIIIEYFRNFEP